MKLDQRDYNGERIFQPRLTKPKQCCENRDGYTAALRNITSNPSETFASYRIIQQARDRDTHTNKKR